MSTSENEAIVQQFYEEIVQGKNLDPVDTLLADDFIHHLPGLQLDRAAFKQLLADLRTAFPDYHAVIEDTIAAGDKVVTRNTMHGTHLGVFQGIPPTGKSFSQTQIHIWRLDQGKIAEHWADRDDLGTLVQLGLFPMPNQTASDAA